MQALVAVVLLAHHPLLLAPLLAAAIGVALVKRLRQRHTRQLRRRFDPAIAPSSRDEIAWQALGVPTRPFLQPLDRTSS
jgi:hypothetical protein